MSLRQLYMLALATGIDPLAIDDSVEMTDDEFRVLLDEIPDEPDPIMPPIELAMMPDPTEASIILRNLAARVDRQNALFPRSNPPPSRGTKPKKSRDANRRRNKASRKARRINR
tara:strand:+ start:821 stop:1162 length:342 start_codon:yes stop_codon:yes gene_type:complete